MSKKQIKVRSQMYHDFFKNYKILTVFTLFCKHEAF